MAGVWKLLGPKTTLIVVSLSLQHRRTQPAQSGSKDPHRREGGLKKNEAILSTFRFSGEKQPRGLQIFVHHESYYCVTIHSLRSFKTVAQTLLGEK